MRKPHLVPAPELIKLNFGCGRTLMPGFVNVDMRKVDGVDVVHDLRRTPWPWAPGAVEEIQCTYLYNFLDPEERLRFMDECFRILRVGGTLRIQTPHANSIRSISDPMFKWPPIAETSFLVFNREWRERNEQSHYPIKCDFDFGYGYGLDPSLNVRSDEYKQMAVKHYNNVILDLIVTLTKRGSEK